MSMHALTVIFMRQWSIEIHFLDRPWNIPFTAFALLCQSSRWGHYPTSRSIEIGLGLSFRIRKTVQIWYLGDWYKEENRGPLPVSALNPAGLYFTGSRHRSRKRPHLPRKARYRNSSAHSPSGCKAVYCRYYPLHSDGSCSFQGITVPGT